MSTPERIRVRRLAGFEARASGDPVKRELQLTCTKCGELLCDVEDGDSLESLVGMAADHKCSTRACIGDGCDGRVPWNQGSDYCDECIAADQP